MLMPGSLVLENWSLSVQTSGALAFPEPNFLWGLRKKFGVGSGAEETCSSWGLCICVPGD